MPNTGKQSFFDNKQISLPLAYTGYLECSTLVNIIVVSVVDDAVVNGNVGLIVGTPLLKQP